MINIQNKEFKKNKLGGYNIDEVNEFMEEIIESYQEMQKENFALKDKINVLNESVQYYHTMESTIQNVLVLADKTAQDTKTAAYQKAEQIKKDAEERAEKMTALAEDRVSRIIDQGRQEAYELAQRVEEAKRQYISYKTQFKQLLQAQVDFLNQGDVKVVNMQEDLSDVFHKIEEDALAKKQKFEGDANSEDTSVKEDEAYYTKTYEPVGE